MAQKIGFIAPGVMGEPMAQRLRGAGYEVVAWARRAERAAELEAAGLRTGTLEEVAACPVIVSCLRDTAAVEELFLRNEAFSEHLAAELVIEHATIAPRVSRQVHAHLAERGIHYLDAAVSGGPAGAAEGSLVTMVGGSGEAMALARPYLEPTCGRIVHIGGPGSGVALKLVNQHLVVAHSVAAAEAAALIRDAGIEPEGALEALMGGWAGSRRLELQLVDSVRGEYGPDGADLDLFREILRLVGGAFEDAGIESTLLPGVEETWDRAAAKHPRGRLASLASAYETD